MSNLLSKIVEMAVADPESELRALVEKRNEGIDTVMDIVDVTYRQYYEGVKEYHFFDSENPEAIEMARDAIGIMGITWEDSQKPLPNPRSIREVVAEPEDIVTLVNVDFTDYRRKNDMRAVKKNCTIPGWLNYAAEKANINFSQVLQAALKQRLNVLDRD